MDQQTIKEWIEIAGYPSVVVGLLVLLWRYLFSPLRKFTGKIKNNSQETLDALPVLFAIARRWPEASGPLSFPTEHDGLSEKATGITARLYAMLDLLPTAIYECDVEGRCTHANTALCDLFGLEHAGMLGSGWLEAIHPADRATTYDSWMNAIAKGIPYEAEYRVRHVESKKLTLCTTVAYPLIEDGDIITYFGKVVTIEGGG